MTEIVLRSESFNLVRVGKKRSVIRYGVCPAGAFGVLTDDPAAFPPLGPAALVNAENEKLRIPVSIHRVSYTAAGLLTTEDAQLDGFLNLAQLLDAMRKNFSVLDLEDLVTILYFRRTDREEG